MRLAALMTWFVLAPALLLGCGDDDSELDRIKQARARFERQNIRDYAFVITGHCFCGFGGRSRQVVQGGVVTSSTHDPDRHGTIDDLFGQMLQRARLFPDVLRQEYDATHGYPTYFHAANNGLEDDFWGFSIDCFSLDLTACPFPE